MSGTSRKFAILLFVAAAFFFFLSVRRPTGDRAGNGDVKPASATRTPPGVSRNELDFERIFRYREPEKAAAAGKDEYVILATGDVLPARSVNTIVSRIGDFAYPYRKTDGFLKTGDLLFVNLETPLISDCRLTDDGMIFCGDARHAAGLVHAGVDIANLANNHMGNYGVPGLESTLKLLSREGIAVTGTGSPAIKTVRGKKFGFLGYNDIGYREEGISWADLPAVKSEVSDLSGKTDFVIVAFHWGVEYVTDPNGRQQELAHAAIDSGADLVVGNHPHWVQAVEFYREGFIAYAHGNFIFDQMWSRETREGVVGRYVFDGNGLKDIGFYPVVIEDYNQPRFAAKSEAEAILGRMKTSSLDLTGNTR